MYSEHRSETLVWSLGRRQPWGQSRRGWPPCRKRGRTWSRTEQWRWVYQGTTSAGGDRKHNIYIFVVCVCSGMTVCSNFMADVDSTTMIKSMGMPRKPMSSVGGFGGNTASLDHQSLSGWGKDQIRFRYCSLSYYWNYHSINYWTIWPFEWKLGGGSQRRY